jgi:bifunctional non-homologous end joining protein LigD
MRITAPGGLVVSGTNHPASPGGYAGQAKHEQQTTKHKEQSTMHTHSTTLYYREGNSDKVYHAAIEAQGDGFIVSFAYGRRGSAMSTGTKTPAPVPYAQAKAIYDKLVKSKTAKGYTPGADGMPYRGTEANGRATGIRCQLANPVDPDRIPAMLKNNAIGVQEKLDGRRLLVLRTGDTITGINRNGLTVAIPDGLYNAIEGLSHDCLLDGELVGEKFHAFDLLELAGHNLRNQCAAVRIAGLYNLLIGHETGPHLAIVYIHTSTYLKTKAIDDVRAGNGEGVVFKDMDAPYTPGRPNSGGAWLKWKFVESASFVTGRSNPGKRSVELLVLDGNNFVPAGNVTIPPNHEVPAPGTVVEIRYLHAFRQSGSVYQPVYLGPRDDISASDCTRDQLKFKDEVPELASA